MRELAEIRFWAKVRRGDGCWEWFGGKKNGYGRFTPIRHKKQWQAHRMAWTLLKGEIPDGTMVLHTCDNRSCCNPAHLFLGNAKANSDDMISKGRKVITVGTRLPQAKLNPQNVIDIRQKLQQGINGVLLGKRYGVSTSTISRVALMQSWAHVE